MSRPEDTGSRTVADAARYEAWRAEDDPPGDDETPMRRRRARPARARGCTCHARSESPCDFCCGDT